jgi:hypothetical protein
MQKKRQMKSFILILLSFLFLLSCSDNGYKTTIDFYNNHRDDFLKSGLINQDFIGRGGYCLRNIDGKIIYQVLIYDTTNIIVLGDLNYFNSTYKVANYTFKKYCRFDFKLIKNDWIGVDDTTTKITNLNRTGLDYFLNIEKLRRKWLIQRIFKNDSSISLVFYNKKNELIYKGSNTYNTNIKRIEKLDFLWTYRKLKNEYE